MDIHIIDSHIINSHIINDISSTRIVVMIKHTWSNQVPIHYTHWARVLVIWRRVSYQAQSRVLIINKMLVNVMAC